MKKNGGKRHILRNILLTLAVLVIVLLCTIWGLWHNEISTALSLRQIIARDDAHLDGSVYRMDVSGGYYFDEFLAEGGAKNDSELIAFITGKITRGLIDMGFPARRSAVRASLPRRPMATGSLAAIMTTPKRIPPSSIRIPAMAAMHPIPRWICSSLASMRTAMWRA